MVSHKEALASEDISVVKSAISGVKGQITKYTNRLNIVLGQKKDDDFDFSQISNVEVSQGKLKIEENFELFQQLQIRHCELLDMSDEEEIKEADQEEAKLFGEVCSKVYPVLESVSAYMRSVDHSKRVSSEEEQKAKAIEDESKAKKDLSASITRKVAAQARALQTYTVEKEGALKLTACVRDKSGDDDVSNIANIRFQPVEATRNSLKQSFENLETLSNELCALLVSRGDPQDAIDKMIEFDYAVEYKAVKNIFIDLGVMELAQKEKSSSSSVTTGKESKVTPIKINKPDPIKFSGQPRDFATFKREFEAIVVPRRDPSDVGFHLKQAVPSKHRHLLDNIDLSKYEEMMEVLRQEFGSRGKVVKSVTMEIDKMKAVTSDANFVEFVEKLEKVRRDLESVDYLEDLTTASTISKIEEKLPSLVKIDWKKIVIKEKYRDKSAKENFDKLMEFLIEYKEIVKYDLSEGNKTSVQTCLGFPAVKSPQATPSPKTKNNKGDSMKFKPCIGCNDGITDLNSILHGVEDCAVWKSLSLKEKESKVMCKKHPFAIDHNTNSCKLKARECKYCKDTSHHFLLCPKKKTATNSAKVSLKSNHTTNKPTCAVKQSTLDVPVIVQALFVRSGGRRLGTLLDNCSTDNYVTHDMAKKLKLSGEDVLLEVEGVGGVKTEVDSKIYKVPVTDIYGIEHTVECYGMDVITSPANPPEPESYAKLCAKFHVKPEQMRRPKYIDLLLSMREHYLLSDHKESSIAGMALYKGPLGLVFGGLDRELRFEHHKIAFNSTKVVVRTVPSCVMRATVKEVTRSFTVKTDKEILDFFKEESIGAQANPACGGCLCGNCALGGRQMSLKDEKSYDFFFKGMRYDKDGTSEDPGPYWRINFPWIVDKNELVDNKAAVVGVMNATMRKLEKDKQWRSVYEQQLKDLLSKGFAREVPESEIEEKKAAGWKTYYIAHQMALNPSSKTTPVRVVYNCSQVYKGHSLNSCLALGPENGLASLHGVLLRLREGPYAAQGDISKQYYMIRLEPEEEMMQLWLWQFEGTDQVKTHCMTRLVMGLIPSTNIAVIAMKETSKLGNFKVDKPDAHQALSKDSYADNTFVMGNSPEAVKNKVAEVEYVAGQGGFKYKEWTFSGEKVPHHVISVHLPNQIGVEEEKALGLYWDVAADEFYVKVDVTCGSKKKSGSSKIIISEDSGRCIIDTKQLVPKLTLRDCLSIHSKPFDPLGFVLPVRMVGNLLFRKSLQVMNTKESREANNVKGPIPWDLEVPPEFVDEWLDYFTSLSQLKDVKFPRSVVPKDVDPNFLPIGVTFDDGNPDSSGANAYGIWRKLDGSYVAALLIAKAKLAPLQYKGETVRQELAGATKAARLKCWVLQHTGLEFSEWIHFLDSRIVQDMIRKDSYGFGTYAGLRIAEIQQKTDIDKWFHIESAENISDILTRGAKPKDIKQGTAWQNGPSWLVLDRSQWPITEVVLTNTEKDVIAQYAHKKVDTKTITANENVCNTTRAVTGTFNTIGSSSRNFNTTGHNGPFNTTCSNGVPFNTTGPNGVPFNTTGPNGVLFNTTGPNAAQHNTTLSPPETETSCKFPSEDETQDVTNEIDVRRFSSWSKLLNVTAKVIQVKYNWYHKYEPIDEHEALEKAEKCWYLSMMKMTKQMMTTTKLPSFNVETIDGIIYAMTRTTTENYNPDKLMILSPRHPVTRLILREIHEVDHKGVQHTVARSRLKYWIPRCGQIVRKIKANCFTCRLKDAVAIRQQMAPMPSFRTKSSPVWNNSMIDLFGPIQIKDFVNQRTTRKTWAVLITCLSTRACQAYLAQSFSTDDLLLVLMKHEARNGAPSNYYSDLGSQIVGADRVMTEASINIEKEKLNKYGKKNRTRFHFGAAHHPEGQGAVERLVQEMKKSLKVLTKNYILSFNEMDTALAEASYLVNCRPLQISPTLGDDGFICPNDIIMGRSDKAPVLDYILDTTLTKRVSHIRRMSLEFWEKWCNSYYQSLVKYHKWRLKYRNCEVGDVVLVLDKEAPKGKFTLGIIDSVKVDSDGLIRKVTVKYKLPQNGDNLNLNPMHYKYAQRNVRGLALLITAQEREQIQTNGNIQIDVARSQEMSEEDASSSNSESNSDDEEPTEDPIDAKPSNDEEVEEANEASISKNDESRILPPTSTGRKRFKPVKLDL